MIKPPTSSNTPTKLHTGSDVSHLLKVHNKGIIGRLVGEIEVRPREQSHMSLGTFSSEEKPKGFAAYFNPDPQEDVIVMQIASLDTKNGSSEFILHVVNYGDQTISAEMRQL